MQSEQRRKKAWPPKTSLPATSLARATTRRNITEYSGDDAADDVMTTATMLRMKMRGKVSRADNSDDDRNADGGGDEYAARQGVTNYCGDDVEVNDGAGLRARG